MTILDDIFAYKRQELVERKQARSLSDVQADARRAVPARDLVTALKDSPSRPALIAEVKRASPSRGVLAPNLDPVRLAQIYQQHGAAVISVLTDEHYFQGHLDDLTAIRQVVDLPVLRKDFIFDPYQVYEARGVGADALLLIAAMLNDEELRTLHDLTRALGMTALIEVHDETEIQRALAVDPGLIGINNRDLRIFEVDIETTARLRPFVPPRVTLVAESGIHTTADVNRMAQIGADAILVGESLVVAEDTGAQVRELVRPYTRVKICGITTREDAVAAIDAGADMLGFNFYPKSKRYVTPQKCARIVSFLAQYTARVKMVGIFVNATRAEIERIAHDCHLDLVQLSGDEPSEFLTDLDVEAFKGIRPSSLAEAQADAARFARSSSPALLVDAYQPGEYGGTGHTGDWALAQELATEYPILLAGGLTPDNVAAAIAQVHPWGVDVASGVESDPGKKDSDKMRAFVEAARRSSGENPMQPTRQTLPQKFGPYGGQFVPDTLMAALDELEAAYVALKHDQAFQKELDDLLHTYVGRPTPISHARRLSEALGGAQIYLKREDLAHSGAHKINNALGQALLAQRLGKERIIAETGAGQHGVATATAAALLGLDCVVYMGTVDIARQQPNVLRMKLLGAEVRPVESGSKTLKDAINEAIRDWVTNVESTHYLLGSALGPHPYPTIVRDFQAVIGREARAQMMEQTGRLPDICIACVGGGSNAIGLFSGFRDDEAVQLVGVEAGGTGIESGKHAARFADPSMGRPGVLHGTYTYILQDPNGQIAGTHSISAGLDYAAVGPEHVHLRDLGRAEYTYATDDEVLEAFQALCRSEGIIPALESTHAVVEATKRAPQMPPEQIILINLSGRGDKDLDTVIQALNMTEERDQ